MCLVYDENAYASNSGTVDWVGAPRDFLVHLRLLSGPSMALAHAHDSSELDTLQSARGVATGVWWCVHVLGCMRHPAAQGQSSREREGSLPTWTSLLCSARLWTETSRNIAKQDITFLSSTENTEYRTIVDGHVAKILRGHDGRSCAWFHGQCKSFTQLAKPWRAALLLFANTLRLEEDKRQLHNTVHVCMRLLPAKTEAPVLAHRQYPQIP